MVCLTFWHINKTRLKGASTTKIHRTTQHSQSIEWIEKKRVSYVKQILNGLFFVRLIQRWTQETNAILTYLIECFVSQNRCIDFCIKYKCCYFNVLLWKFFCFISHSRCSTEQTTWDMSIGFMGKCQWIYRKKNNSNLTGETTTERLYLIVFKPCFPTQVHNALWPKSRVSDSFALQSAYVRDLWLWIKLLFVCKASECSYVSLTPFHTAPYHIIYTHTIHTWHCLPNEFTEYLTMFFFGIRKAEHILRFD